MVTWKIFVDTWWFLPALRCDFVIFQMILSQDVGIVLALGSLLSVLFFFLHAFVLRLWTILFFGDLPGNRRRKNLCLGQEEYARLKLIVLGPTTRILQLLSGWKSALAQNARDSFYYYSSWVTEIWLHICDSVLEWVSVSVLKLYKILSVTGI